MEITTIKAKPRTAVGKHPVRELRTQGYIPAVVYGDGKDPESVQVGEYDLVNHMRHHHRVFQLDVAGKQQSILLQDVQWDVLTDRVTHVDFKRIDLTKPISVLVEVMFLGHPVGIAKGGRLIKDHPEVRVKCLPMEIPESLEVNVASLDIDDKIVAKTVVLPKGVTLDMPAEAVVCHVAYQKVEVLPAATPAVAEAAAAPAEGAAAPAAGAAAPAADAKKGAAAPAADAKKAPPAAGDKPAKK